MMFRLKRIYDIDMKMVSHKVFVGRVWPRDTAKESINLDLWLKGRDLHTSLRKWFGHDSAKREIFKTKYKDELKAKQNLLDQLKALGQEHQEITLLYTAKDTRCIHSLVLKEAL